MESKMSIYLTSEETNKLLDKELDKVYENQVKKEITEFGEIYISPSYLIKTKNPKKYQEFFDNFCKRNNINIVDSKELEESL
jgi:hypothetical protein